MMKRRKQGSNPLSVVVLLLIVGGSIIYQLTYGMSTPCTPAQTFHRTSVSAIWTKQNVYIDKSERTQLIAVKGKLIYIGRRDFYHPGGLVAVDEGTGEVLWQSENSGLFTLTESNGVLFAGGVAKVTAISPDNGKVIWTTNLLANVTKLLVRENVLYVDTTKSYFLLEPETGKIIRSLEYTVDDNWNPDLPPWSNHLRDLEFVNNISFFQKQIGWPNVTAVKIVATDETKKSQLWSSTLPILGQAAISPLGIVVVEEEGTLLRLDVENGTMSELVKFEPSPAKGFECPDGGWFSYGFSVAVDVDKQMVFVYLGDGTELSAFKVSR